MITVYFEYKTGAEIVATFQTEELYIACLPILEEEADKRGCILTESMGF